MNFFVSPSGDDRNPGTEQLPFATLTKARDAVRGCAQRQKEPVTVFLREGTYYLSEPLVLDARDSGAAHAPVRYQACSGETATVSGARRLHCTWEPYKDGILMCRVPEARGGTLDFTQLFANGSRQIRARYPNRNDAMPDKRAGYINPAKALGDNLPAPLPDRDADMTYDGEPHKGIAFNPETFTRNKWARPDEAVIHIFQAYYWGNLQWHIKHIDWDAHQIWFGEGGHQMGAKWATSPAEIGERSRFYIENVFEELDAPAEWYLDKTEGVLYWMPPEGMDPATAIIEVPVLKQLVGFAGTRLESVEHVEFNSIHFSGTTTTLFERYEIPSLGDWALYRGGAILMDGTRHCAIRNCLCAGLGGNAVFVNCFNRDLDITGCTFHDIGDSAVLLVGELETTNGTEKRFPYECRVTNNLFYDLGLFGKQTAGVYISRAKRITVGHNLMHDLPRAGICIGDGTWGGHVIEFNHIHDSCLETEDHGPLNAWGRDRTWSAVHGQSEMLKSRCIDAAHSKSDAMETVIIRNNLFEEKKGWGLDLDDGATNYEIFNNICVGIGMKLREGSYRTIYNNIWYHCANSPCFHVGNEDNHDQYYCNITVMSPAYQKAAHDRLFKMRSSGNEIYTLIFPPVRTPWLERIDNNCYVNDSGTFTARVLEREGKEYRDVDLAEWNERGFDKNSIFGDPQFLDPARNDFRVKPDSPALKLGFKNFEMGAWGLTREFPAFKK